MMRKGEGSEAVTISSLQQLDGISNLFDFDR
jgi:hypothetical protein